MLTVSEITKRFDNITALQSIHFSAKPGEILGIVGPDGAGKSTLLRILAGTLQPDEGSIVFEDDDVTKSLFAYKDKISYLPQRFGLYEDLTVMENIIFFGRIHGMKEADCIKRGLPLLAAADMQRFTGRLAGKLSGGMKQKLGLACALVHNPEIVILDEPTNGVDPVSRREFWSILYTLLRQKKTVIVSTSYLDEAERCSRVIMLDGGVMREFGTPAQVKKRLGRKVLVLKSANMRAVESALKHNYPTLIRSGEYLRILSADASADIRHIKNQTRRYEVSISVREPNLEDCLWKIVTEDSSDA